ncbi:GntR family transcriptional regulator [Methyloterricola oryzae]|uniref:GntR family transcriptional regulator n=1 Tax=Methyloterricola oryzae TaxID=1495050 RepID=UPI0005EB85D9|nr:GntR family transcriptional regulator [Methyloterricola oryzae]
MKPGRKSEARHPPRLSEKVYDQLKQAIFDFRLLPGDRLTEIAIAEEMQVSRTPVRQALTRLEQEGYLKVAYRNGWNVKPLDFKLFDQRYDLRIILELAAVDMICSREEPADLTALADLWLVPESARLEDPWEVAGMDEAFHQGLLAATGNVEMLRVHRDITEKIRIIRRLDFTQSERIRATYEEHAQILRLLMQRKAAAAGMLLQSHIEASKAEVRKITLHKLQSARDPGAEPAIP